MNDRQVRCQWWNRLEIILDILEKSLLKMVWFFLDINNNLLVSREIVVYSVVSRCVPSFQAFCVFMGTANFLLQTSM